MSTYDEFDGGLYGESLAASDSGAASDTSTAVEVAAQPGPVPDVPVSAGAVDSGPSIPFGWAILGVCAVAVIWAASLDGGKE